MNSNSPNDALDEDDGNSEELSSSDEEADDVCNNQITSTTPLIADSPQTDIASIEAQQYSSHQTNQNPSRVLKDIYHFMALIKVPKRHMLAKEFSRRLRDAIFVVDPHDRRKVEEYLAKQGLTWTYMLNSNPSWILRRVKRFVPPPNELGPVVQNLFTEYGNLICTRTGRRLFDNDARHQAQNMLKAIYEGQISDHPDVSMYFKIGYDKKAGLPLYRCCRGTNSLEGGVHENIIRAIGSSGAGPHMAHCFLAEYRLRHNIRVGTMNRYQRMHKGHYDPWLTEALLYLRMKLGIVATDGGIVEHGAGILTPGLHLKASDETFGVSRMAADVAEELGIHLATAVTQQQHDQHLPMVRPHALDISINIMLPSGSTANPKNKRYVFLADKQGVKYAVTPIHTQEEFIKFNNIIPKESINASQWVDLAKKWNTCKLKEVDGSTIFYKTPDHLKLHFERWNERRMTSASAAISNGVCDTMREDLQSPSRGQFMLLANTPSRPPFAITPPLTAPPYQPSFPAAATAQTTATVSTSATTIQTYSPPAAKRIAPALASSSIPSEPLFRVNVNIPKKRARRKTIAGDTPQNRVHP